MVYDERSFFELIKNSGISQELVIGMYIQTDFFRQDSIDSSVNDSSDFMG